MRKENETISRVLLTIEQYKGNIGTFRNAALSDDYSPKNKNFTRLLLWKLCLITETLNIQAWAEKLRISRVVYYKLRHTSDMAVPWWGLEVDDELYLSQEKANKNRSSKPTKLVREKNIAIDPLSSSASLPDSEDDDDLLHSIVLDVHRLFPGEKLLHDGSEAAVKAKRLLVSLLYTWSKCNPLVGYKQGFHEILGLIYMNLVAELVTISNTNTFSADDLSILSLYDTNYLEHDLFTIFNKFVATSGIVGQFYQSEALLMASIECFNGLLMKVDQLIHYNLITKLRLESQLWIIRFFRLLLLRELGNNMSVPTLLWDKFMVVELSKTPGLQCIPDLVMFAIIVLLILLKTELVLCDFSEALSLLLHYPISTKLHIHPNLISSLFKDAYHLYENKDKDIKLYEYGLKLNKKYNTNLRVNVGIASDRSSTPSATASPKSSVEIPGPADTKAAKMAFEKYRLEMRLKKKAQLMLTRGG